MKQKIKIGLQIAAQMKNLKLKKFHIAAFAEISRTQLDKILCGESDYTISTLLKVLKTVDLDINLVDQHKAKEPAKNHVKKVKKDTGIHMDTVIIDDLKPANKTISWP